MLRFFKSLVLILFSCQLHAANERCSSMNHGVFRDVEDFHNHIHQVVDYYEGSLRQEVGKMSAQDQDRFAATGEIRCKGKSRGSAQLTVKNDILTSAAHTFTNRETCAKEYDPSDCVFEVKFNGKFQRVPIEKKLAAGFVCPPPNNKLPLKSYRDWIVLKLKSPILGVTPYQIDPEKARNIREGDPVITIGTSTDFHARIVNGDWITPKHYGTCSVMNVDRLAEPYLIATACGCSGGCSGGSLLSDDNKPTILGVFSGNWETNKQAYREYLSGHPDRVKWNLDTASSFYVPLTGDFLKAVQDATGTGSI